MTDRIVGMIRAEIGTEVKVAATGGHAEVMAKLSQTIEYVDPWLTLDGLRLIHDRVRGSD